MVILSLGTVNYKSYDVDQPPRHNEAVLLEAGWCDSVASNSYYATMTETD